MNSIRYNANGNVYASTGGDRSIRVFDGRTGCPIGYIDKAHNGSILCLCWVDNREHLLVTCSTDRTVRLWDTSDGNPSLVDTLSPYDMDSQAIPS